MHRNPQHFVTAAFPCAVGEGGVLDLQKLGLEEELSMRVRVGRNLAKFNLPGAMDKDERILFEKVAVTVVERASPCKYGNPFHMARSMAILSHVT